jgi:regulator of sigma E protease
MVDESMDSKQLETPPQPWEFRSKPRFQRFVVVAAGSVMNLLLAFAIFTTAAWMQGVSKPLDGTVLGQLVEGRPAVAAGLKAGDKIVRVNGKEMSTWDQLTDVVHSSPNIPLRFEWKRGDSLLSAVITPVKEKIVEKDDLQEVGLIGIYPQVEVEKIGFSDPSVRRHQCYHLAKLVLNPGHPITERNRLNPAGPVFIAKWLESAKSGFTALIGFMALLSLNPGF